MKMKIREQSQSQVSAQAFVTDDNYLNQGLEFECFPGYNKLNEKYENKTALVKDSTKSPGGKVYATSTDRAGFFNLTTLDKDGKLYYKSIFNCKAITENNYAKFKLRDDQERTIKPLLDSKRYKTPDDTEASQTTHNWVDIHNDEGAKKLLGATIDYLSKPFMMWKLKSKVESFDDPFETDSRTSDFIKMLEDQKWKRLPAASELKNYIMCDLANTTSGPTNAGQNCYKYSAYKDYIGYAQLFTKTGFTFYMPKTIEGGVGETSDTRVGQYQYFCKGAKTNNYDKKSCYTCILNYFNAAKNGADTTPDPGYKEMVEECLAINQEDFPKLSNVIDYLRGVGMGANQKEWLISRKSYKQQKQGGLFGLGKVKTNENIKIQKVIRESLQVIKNNKKLLISEGKIIKNRLVVLSEGRNLKQKRNLDIFFDRFLTETAYWNSKGYNTDVINEQFADMLSNFFTGNVMDSVFQYFKEYAVKWLLGKFGMDPDGLIGTAIAVAVGNINIGDITKLTDCDYVTPLIAKSIVETIAKRFLDSKNLNNPFMDVVRNSVVEMIDNTQFAQTLEKNLAGIICPLVGQLGGKMNTITSKLTGQGSQAGQAPSSADNVGKSISGTLGSAKDLMGSMGSLLGGKSQ